MATLATAREIQKYMDYKSVSEFAKDWRELDDDDKAFYKAEVGKLKDAGMI